MGHRSRSLEAELADLRDEVEDLRSEVNRLRREVRDLRRERGDSRRSALSSVDSRSDSRGGYGSPSPSTAPASDRPSPEPERASQSRTSNGRGGSSSATNLSWIEREAICDRIGAFFISALEGRHRGNSGREEIPCASRFRIVARDHSGQIYTPVKVLRSWTSCKALVCPGGADPADSVLVGVPSEREARRVVHAAHLEWPQAIEP